MRFTESPLQGAYVIDIEPIKDERGFFARSFCKKEFEKMGLHTEFVQSNLSYNEKKSTLRGMHYQASPYEEIKIVSCIKGSIFDVIVDIRNDSQTYMKWFDCHLSHDNNKMLYIPKGFAHGFQALEDNSLVMYMMSEYYHSECAKVIQYDDEYISIDWPIKENIIISNKDRGYK